MRKFNSSTSLYMWSRALLCLQHHQYYINHGENLNKQRGEDVGPMYKNHGETIRETTHGIQITPLTNLSISDPMSIAMSFSSPKRLLKSESASSCFPFSICIVNKRQNCISLQGQGEKHKQILQYPVQTNNDISVEGC